MSDLASFLLIAHHAEEVGSHPSFYIASGIPGPRWVNRKYISKGNLRIFKFAELSGYVHKGSQRDVVHVI